MFAHFSTVPDLWRSCFKPYERVGWFVLGCLQREQTLNFKALPGHGQGRATQRSPPWTATTTADARVGAIFGAWPAWLRSVQTATSLCQAFACSEVERLSMEQAAWLEQAAQPDASRPQ
ncbi:MAG: hypothetical protein ABIX46_12255 [Burkholderiaceae bacterium]